MRTEASIRSVDGSSPTNVPSGGLTVLFLNHPAQACGVHQFGRAFHEYVAASQSVTVVYREVDGPGGLARCLGERGWDLVVANFHPDTMRWLTRSVVKSIGAPVIGVAHDFDHETCHVVDADRFRYRILCDPTVDARVPGVFVLPRVAPPFAPTERRGGGVVVGSLGLGTPGKGFERVVLLAQREFDEATVRLHIPPSHFADPTGDMARQIGERCRALVRKPGIQVEITHDLKDREGLLEFLAGNSINVFLYDQQRGRGVSSVIDLAVAAGRPIATSDSNMFRALLAGAPGCALETRTLRDVLEAGPGEVLALKAEWTPDRLRRAFERVVTEVVQLERARVAGAVKFNGVLDDLERARYSRTIGQLEELAPETIARKIPRANVQQAFVKDAVEFFTRGDRTARVLCVGAFEDTASHALQRLGFQVEEIDPALNCSLAEFVRRPTTGVGTYDVVFSTSVIEHVPDDEEFIAHIARLLRPGGVAILTLDFKAGYKPGDPKPLVDERLYTLDELLGRLLLVNVDCELVDVPDWLHGEPDFVYEGVAYGFATLTFRKRRVARNRNDGLARALAENALLRRRIGTLEMELATRPRPVRERLLRRLGRLVRFVRR